MAQFWKVVNKIIKESDVVLHILDARDVDKSLNEELVHKIRNANKKIIFVLNKSDLADQFTLEAEKKKFKTAVFVSANDYAGMRKLKDRIIIEGKRLTKERPVIGVVGYPNVGKSSIINALKGNAATRTSSESGHTKGVQKISTRNFILLDSPGVLPFNEEDDKKHATIGAIDFSKIKDPEEVVFSIMEDHPKLLEKNYKIDAEYDDFLEKLAMQMNFLAKGGKPDTKRAATFVLKEWQTGKIKNFD